MSDNTEDLRMADLIAINSGLIGPDGQTWTTEELARDFDVQGFLAPYVVVRRKSDGRQGTLQFRHNPRIYFNWQED